MIQAVIFDCFGVLYLDPTQAFYQRLTPRYHELHSGLLELDKQYDYGLITAEEHARAVSDLTGVSLEEVRSGIRSDRRRNDELVNVCQQLRNSYKVGMISNIGKGGVEPFFPENVRKQLFDDVILSNEIMLIKPSPEIFTLAAERLEVPVDQCVMIDDRAENCEGARRAGMQAILHTSNHTTLEHLREFGVTI